ncbi:MAG: hypothetical protein ACJ73S_26435 [Mycobacteriales bacterium]
MGTEAFARWHVGPWTGRATADGEPRQPGRRRTPDEFHFDVVGLATHLGRRLSPAEELQVRLWQTELRPTHTRRCGEHELADPANARKLAEAAGVALAWLRERAPAGYRFVVTDAVELVPDTDPDAAVVPVDGVVELVGGVDLPSAALACAHVRESRAGWIAADVARVLAGPYPDAVAAVGAVRAARERLAGELRAVGRDDLAGTAPRWNTIPVEPSPVR